MQHHTYIDAKNHRISQPNRCMYMYIPSTSADTVPAHANANPTRRDFSSNPVENTNIKIGIATAVIGGLFLGLVFAFLWVYRYSVRCTYRKKRKHRSRHGSNASKASGSGSVADKAPAASGANGGEAPEAEAEAAADKPAEEAPKDEAADAGPADAPAEESNEDAPEDEAT